jgi:hypothetical protein
MREDFTEEQTSQSDGGSAPELARRVSLAEKMRERRG